MQIEMGDLHVGRISNHQFTRFSRVDEDIRRYAATGVEVLVKAGERVAGGYTC